MGSKVKTGIEGLDEILSGGLLPNRSYLVQGGPGVGKSTLGYHFLAEANKDENTLLISLSESKESIHENSSRQGIDLSATHILDLSPDPDRCKDAGGYNVFSPSEVEQEPITQKVRKVVEEQQPSRVVLDSITMLNMLNADPFQARNLALSFIRFICNSGATLLMLSEQTKDSDDSAYWVDGIMNLVPDTDWRKIRVTKFRGSDYLSGSHAYKITDKGITVFPKLQPHNYERTFGSDQLSSGIPEMDEMLHGGLERGTTTLLTGPSGVGKTNMGTQFIHEAARRGNRSAIYTFEESEEVIINRSEGINVPIKEIIQQGKLKISSIEPLSYSPDEFSKRVRTDVEENDTRIVMIDSIGGYKFAVGEKDALARLHSLCVYLQNMGVTTILVNETKNVFGDFKATEINASYLADNIVFLRYLEMRGELTKAIGILKKRLSDFEKGIRRFQITNKGIKVGDALSNVRGVLNGSAEFIEKNP